MSKLPQQFADVKQELLKRVERLKLLADAEVARVAGGNRVRDGRDHSTIDERRERAEMHQVAAQIADKLGAGRRACRDNLLDELLRLVQHLGMLSKRQIRKRRMRAESAEADVLLSLRVAAGLSRAELADRVGVDRTAIWYWETGRYFPQRGNLKNFVEECGSTLAAYEQAVAKREAA